MTDNVLVKVHPNVILGIIDAYERRTKNKGVNDAALGTLFGCYERNAVRITNCCAVPVDLEKGELDHKVNLALLNMHMQSYQHDLIVGWFLTNVNFNQYTMHFQEYYKKLAETVRKMRFAPPIILLTVDTTAGKMDDGLAIRAFTADVPEDQDHSADDSEDEEDEDEEEVDVMSKFRELKVKIETTDQESSALITIMKGTESKAREVHLTMTEHAEEFMCDEVSTHLNQMIEWLKTIKQYVDQQMKKDLAKRDHDMGRRLMDVVRTASTLLHPDKLENIVKITLRDQILITYIAELLKTNVEVLDKLVQDMCASD